MRLDRAITLCIHLLHSESQGGQGSQVILLVAGPRCDPPPPESLGDDEGQFKRLGGIQSWVTVGVVARAQVIKGHGS